MIPSKNCIDLIKQFEGCKLNAYPDPGSSNGLPVTIGWGNTKYENGKPIHLGDTITQGQADQLLANEVAKVGQSVSGLLNGSNVSQNQFDAIVCFAYNVGMGNLANSTLLKLVKAGKDASGEFEKWNKASGKVLHGLTRRRLAEKKLYQTT